jgi:aromatic ring-opening dioxygenase LigB subunit
MLVFAAIMPHPPESMPGIGDRASFVALKKTINSFKQLATDLEKADPETIIIISPHAQMEKYAFVINSDIELKGTLINFGLDKVFAYENNVEMADKISFASQMNEDIATRLQAGFLDHGTLIPLFHLAKKIKPKIVHLSFSLMNYERHYRYGEIIQSVIDGQYFGRVAVIASADLSHCLNKNAPCGFSKDATAFDRDVLHYLGAGDLASLMRIEESETQKIKECGLRSIIILLGILHGKPQNFKLLSYEAPFGVGYLTARLL